jgi:transcriptional regulator with XRE-family HTH domain
MTATLEHPARWEQPDYQTITAVSYDGHLAVHFANGDVAAVAVDRLVRPDATELNWGEVGHSAHEVLVPMADGDTAEISWMDIRAQSDPGLAEFLIKTADEEAQRIGRRLRVLRERRGMTSKQVAEAAGIAPLSLSRIELGRHDVVYRTLRRILAAMNYDLRDLAEVSEPQLDVEAVAKRLRHAGVPRGVIDQMKNALGSHPARLTAAVERIFRWSPDQLAGTGGLPVRPAAAATGRFKSQVNQDPALATYTMWAHWLALSVDQAVPRGPAAVPENPYVIREEILQKHDRLRFPELLDWCWAHGVAVLPLQDPGEFHGAAWNIDGRVVIVLKQRTPWESRWTFDLGHELGHIARHLDTSRPSLVELAETNPLAPTDDDDEQEANDFAGELVLSDADAIAQEAAERSLHRLPRLKREVSAVAHEHKVDPGALASYVAWRLELEGQNWWATAAKLQDPAVDAPRLASIALLERLDWERLTDDDATLLRAALAWSVPE